MRSVLISHPIFTQSPLFPAISLSISFLHSHKNPTTCLSLHPIPTFLHLPSIICKNPCKIKEFHSQAKLHSVPDNKPQVLRSLRSFDLDTALLIFNQIKNPLQFHYNSIIQACCKSNSPDLAISFYVRMLGHGRKPNHFTFPSLIAACAHQFLVLEGTQIHSHVLKMGLVEDQFLQSSLIHMYSSFGDMGSARVLFDEMPERNVVVWTALVNGYSKLGELERARWVFDEMPERNVVVWTALVNGYSKLGELERARWVFDEMPEKDVIAWSALISGYVQEGKFKEGLSVFNEMQVEGVTANESVLVSVLSACSHLGALDLGRWVHLYVERRFGHELSVNLGTALVDMYAKCGVLSASLRIFQGLPCKNVLSWNAMMGGFALYGHGRGALGLFFKYAQGGIEA